MSNKHIPSKYDTQSWINMYSDSDSRTKRSVKKVRNISQEENYRSISKRK